ncbi:MAG: HD domain-containing protein [Bacillota bacterium]|nr:HD domain-containing protein [Bacillota bacterium]
MDQKTRLDKQMEFCREIDKEKEVFRQSYLCSGSRHENDAEHAWHMAIMAVILQEYANEDVDLLKTMTMLLIHDIVEIDAGDTYAYDVEGLKTQKEREAKAADRIFNILPEDQAKKMLELFAEFEGGETAEARFARALDNIQPIMLNDASDGKDWQEKGIRISQALGRQRLTAKGSEVLWKEFSKPLLQRNIDRGHIIGDISLDEFDEPEE